jgi:hypothetical protein
MSRYTINKLDAEVGYIVVCLGVLFTMSYKN